MPFKLLPQLLPKIDIRYLHWRNSLKKRSSVWNKGKTKENNESINKISQTFKLKKINNFKDWRNRMIENGTIKLPKSKLSKCYDLAVFIGLVLGDGHIQKFPRTERLLIVLNTKYPQLIKYTAYLTERLFDKIPAIEYKNNANYARISLYQKNISDRLGVIAGNRAKDYIGVPTWIWKEKQYIIGCLKGLFEAEGSLSIHLQTCTYNFQFSNKSQKLLDDVKRGLIGLGYHPEIRINAIRLRKKIEVGTFNKLIQFRDYSQCGIV